MKSDKIKGHSAVLTANIIFGLGIPVTKYLLDHWVTPMGYMLFRCLGATLIFWVIGSFLPEEHVNKKDLLIIMAGGLLGFVISQTLTAWALKFTTPVYFSLIATLTPVATMLMAALFISENITLKKTIGILAGIAGAILMVLMGQQSGSGSNDLLGITLAILSLLTWAVYLIITRKVSEKYTPVTQMKWVFLVSTIAVLPFTWKEFLIQPIFTGLPGQNLWHGITGMLFVVVLATVLGYFLIPYSMKYLRATTVSVYTNLQPIVASVVAFAVGQDMLTWDKFVAAALVLCSAYIVTNAPNK